MVWVLLGVVVVFVAFRLARRGSSGIATVSASSSVVVMSKRPTAKTKAALDAATASLR